MFPRLTNALPCVALCVAGAIGVAASPAFAAGSLTGAYFILSASHPDVGHGIDGRIVKGLVQKRLGPDGLPVVTAFARSYSGPSGAIKDVNSAGELMWYKHGREKNGVRREKLVTQHLPFAFPRSIPTGVPPMAEATDILPSIGAETFTLPKTESISFTEGSDDDSWVFVDGTLVGDNGGVKPAAAAPFTVAHVAAGQHRFDVFYADRHTSGAEMDLATAFALVPGTTAALPPPKAAPPVPSAASLASQIKKTGHVAVYGIHFAFDKADITKDSTAVLAQVAKVLRADPSLRLRIEGHTDATGDAGYNRDLSQRRADAVKSYLVSRFAISAGRLTTQGFGPDRPIATNATSQGRFKNRRVELVRL